MIFRIPQQPQIHKAINLDLGIFFGLIIYVFGVPRQDSSFGQFKDTKQLQFNQLY